MNKTKLEAIIETPRFVNDDRYDSLNLHYIKNRDTLTIVQLGGVIIAILFSILGFLDVTSYTLAILGLIVFLGVLLFNKFYLKEKNIKLTRKAAGRAPASAMALVQASDYYGVMVFSKNDKSLQADPEKLLSITETLREIRAQGNSNNPSILHIQNRLWDTQDYFSAEELDPTIVGAQGVWWKAESISENIPDNFNENKDSLLGFIKEEENEIYLSLVKKDFYGKYLS